MQVLAVGLNHTTAPMTLREKVAFSPEQLAQAVEAARSWLVRFGGASAREETAILSTCNRTELYAVSDAHDLIEAAAHFLSDYHRLRYADLRPYLYVLPQREAVRHAFRVASGLDSMVLGEAQILGQMKEAVRCAEAAGGLGTYLHQMFQRSFEVAKEVRSSTEIGSQSISLAAAAVRLAQRIFEDVCDAHVLCVGAGEMIGLCATHFCAQQPKSFTVANRTLERGDVLAKRFGGRSIRLAELPDTLFHFDIIISCTAASIPIIGLGMVERAVKLRQHRPMFMIDLGVPRDIEPEVGRLDDVFLYTVDDLGVVVQNGLRHRQSALTQAEAIIEARVKSYMNWVDSRALVPAILSLQEEGEAIRAHELERARKRLIQGEDPELVLQALSHGITGKFLHGPRRALRQAEGEDRAQLAKWLPSIFRCRH